MVCSRCILTVRKILEPLGYNIKSVELGEVVLLSPNPIDTNNIEKQLAKVGFELIVNKDEVLVEQIKIEVISMIQTTEKSPINVTTSEYLASKLGKSYSLLSKTFSRQENLTLEKYIILQKIERVKELLQYGELSLGEIANRLNYSSVQHLSRQFKSIVGKNVRSFLKDNGGKLRIPLDKVEDVDLD